MLSIRTVIRFLFFDADAIRDIAGNRKSLWIGLLFVIAAGFAREYDGEYLVAEPFHLLIPVAASTIGCLVMVVLLYLLAWCRGDRHAGFAEVFLSFLAVYWMTGPLALVYGIPVERLMDPEYATAANLGLLLVVAIWRVLLMIRCVQVVYRMSFQVALFPVMLFSVCLTLAALNMIPGPIFMIMGGVRLSESEQLILNVRIWLVLLSTLSFPVWLIGFIVMLSRKTELKFTRVDLNPPGVSRSLWIAAVISILFWIPFLPFTQAEQRLRWQADRFVVSDDIDQFVGILTEHDRSAFPPHWDPPPRLGYGDRGPDPAYVLVMLHKNDGPRWVIDLYEQKLESQRYSWWFGSPFDSDEDYHSGSSMSDKELEDFVDVIFRMENRVQFAEILISRTRTSEEDMSPRRRELFQKVGALAEQADIDDDEPGQESRENGDATMNSNDDPDDAIE